MKRWYHRLFGAGKEHPMDANKLKYDVLRHGLRRMIAEGRFGGKNDLAVCNLLESVRGKGEKDLDRLATAAKIQRETARTLTGSNGSPA